MERRRDRRLLPPQNEKAMQKASESNENDGHARGVYPPTGTKGSANTAASYPFSTSLKGAHYTEKYE